MLKEKFHLLGYFSKNTKIDGLKLTDYREISFEENTTFTAEGSARLKLGKTDVIAGVKFEIGSPYEDASDEGSIMINVELLPVSNENFMPGPPTDEAIEIARVVDRGIRESGTIDLKSLCIEKGDKFWTVIVDICVMNDDGNLIDASSMAAMLAIRNAVFPKLEKDGKINYKEKTKDKIKLNQFPIAITCFKIGEFIFVDPTRYEQQFYDSRLTITMTEDDKIVALQKGGEKPVSVDDVERMVELASLKSKEIRKILG